MASSSSPTTTYLKHEVFLSFRGADTRYGFTSHLYRALQRKQIDAYIDNKLAGGEKIEPALLERIEESCISLVIFSENYADSTFCLRELSKILECMETKRQMVLPVFYRLDPSHVQNLTGSYGDALCKHERDCSSEEVESWRRALKEIANVKGWDSNVIKDETELIHEIVTDIQKKLNHELSLSFVAKGLFGMKSRVEDIESLLSFGSTGVLIVGIWGMGGIGKSTTAETVYLRNCSKFEGHCCFRDVREESRKNGVDHVRQEILGNVLEIKDMTIHTKVLTPAIKQKLQRKKVLIVLDDVNDPQDLKYLVGEDGLFGQGSRIMVTSRDRQVLINACDEDKIYEVEILDEDDALRLFSLHAFKQDHPIEEYTGLSKTVVSCVKGIPLVLEVLGGILCNRRSVEYWESTVAQLRINGGEDIKKHLEMCYHELDQTEKKIFLDIACFFGRCKKDFLQQTLDLEERSGIDRLIDMCLIKIVQNTIWMHDVLLKLGKKIVLQENIDPRERSRLWEAGDIYRVLTTQGTGSKVESISLILDATKELTLNPAAFEGMYNLRLLKIYHVPSFLENPSKEQIMNGKRVGIHLPGGLHFLSSELRFLYWYNYPLKSLPSNFFPEKPFQLEMPCSQLEQLWNEGKPLELPRFKSFCNFPSIIGCFSQLVRLNLSSCKSLASLPDNIDELKSLVELDLYSCSKLASLPNNICKLKCLAKLNLGGQPKLTSLPDKIGELRSLAELRLSSCSKLASLPDSIGELRSLTMFNLNGCYRLTSLPDNIGALKSLQWLGLDGCWGLASLPNSIGGLKSLKSLLSRLTSLPDSIDKLISLKSLNLSGLSRLSSLPDSLGELKSLKSLCFSGFSRLANLPDNIGALKYLEDLDLNDCSGLASLPDTIDALKSLKKLHLSGCSGLASLPDTIDALKSLKKLHLSGCSGLASLPYSIGALQSLEYLDLGGCSGLASIPDSIGALQSLRSLNLSGCSGLASLPNSIGALQSLTSLDLSGCSGLASLPNSIGALQSLKSLQLSDCSGLASLPNSIGALQSLKSLHLSDCSGLVSLPDSIGALKSLEYLNLILCSRLASLPDNIGALKSLEYLCLYDCPGVVSLLDNIGALKSLKSLYLNGFSELESLPDSIGALKSLRSLGLHGCSGLASLPDSIGALKSLTFLDLSSCSGLKSLPDNIVELKHLDMLILSGCLKLGSLADNFIDHEFRGLDKQPCYMLRGFQKVEEIASSTYKLGCHQFSNFGNSRVLKTLGSLGSLVSLTRLRLSEIDFERIPASIKHLTKLSELYLDDCKRLQCLPELPSTLQVLIASGCISLKSVASISMQGDREYEVASQEFNFSNCLQLDQNSRTRIMGDACLRIQRMATSLFYQGYHWQPIRVRLCIPGSEVPECFSYKNRGGSSVKIRQLAHWHRGFTLCAIVSFGQSGERRQVNIKCECHLIFKDGTQTDLNSYYYGEYEARERSIICKREHVFIWSVYCQCFFKEASFHFKPLCGATDVVVKCGVHPLLNVLSLVNKIWTDNEVSVRGDVHSFGIMLLELITRQRPTGETLADGLDKEEADLTFQMFEEICDRIKTIQISDSSPSLSSTIGETINSEEESVSNRIRQVSPSQGSTLPILQKIINLSDKIQNLEKEHSNLSNQVKTAKDSFLGPNILDTLQKLGNEYELLEKKYLQELSERKRPYNEVIELKGNIRVFCNEYELLKKKYLEELSERKRLYNEVIELKRNIRVFCRCRPLNQVEITNEAVFVQTKPIVASVLDGYNVCIFAYGQTGTGKTFTMEGSPENRGVNYRTLDELFRVSQERSGIMRYGPFVSMMEVYNEKIRDLLIDSSNQHPKKLEIKQTAEGTQEVPGLVETRVTGTEDVWDLLNSGSRASERVGKIDVEGERLKETQFINKSLSALGDVIFALASKTGHIPFRSFSHTVTLEEIVCKNLMFVQISPSATDLGETLCSLNFASRVRGIETSPACKQADLSELFKYKQMVEKLKHDEKETKKLQDSLQSLQLRLAARERMCRTLQEKVRELENQLGEERKTRLKQETRAFAAAASQSTKQSDLLQFQHRVSIASYRLEPTSNMTPLQTSQYKNGNVVGRQSFVRDPRKPPNSKLFSPLPEFRTASGTTPTVMRTSSTFMGSPPPQAGSWKLKHPTVVALPLKLRSFQNRRPSLLPYRSSSTNEVQ
ncbi:hypothetical protein NC652_012793 [Populus alba x Populus x berolinensis]|nr:hypothetical protein NC652_012793 [Populus alba x Populus x berolinensis]